MTPLGSLEVVCGPMFSGKTDRLIERFERALVEQTLVVAVKPERDDRHAHDRIVSHSGREIPAVSVATAQDIREAAADHALVLIDEVQFLDADLVIDLAGLREFGLDVLAVGLDLDFRRERFPATLALIEHATTVARLAATCSRCGAPAQLTQRLVGGSPAPLDGPQLVVGDRELYEPRCESCWTLERLAPSDRRRTFLNP